MDVQRHDTERWQHLMDRVRSGDQEACHEFWNQYGPRIERLARRRLSPGLQRRVGPESILISACRTFFRRAQEGEFQLPDAAALWRLLAAITVNKVRMRTRYHLRQRRGLQAEEHVDELPEIDAAAAAPVDVLAFEEELQHLVSQFDDEERRVLDLKLQQWTNEQIAAEVRCSERTVRRLMKRIQSRMKTLISS